MNMKKTMAAIAAATVLTATMMTGAMAAPGHMGGHMGGGQHMGGGGHFHGGRGFGIGGLALGAGLGALYDAAPGYGYDDCVQTRLVPTPYGPRYRTVDVCGY